MFLVDAHCHLQDGHLRYGLDQAMDRARRAGVGLLFCNGTAEDDWDYVLSLPVRHSEVLPWLGLHPWFVDEARPGWQERLERLLGDGVCGLGEIGLDRAVEGADVDRQEEAFVAQLRLASKHRLPVSIHCRKAWERLVALLRAEGGLRYGGIVHSYAGSAEMVPVLEALGCSISFSCSLTRPNNKRARRACRYVSMDRLLVETDSPAIAPEGVERDRNEPENLVLVVRALAQLLNLSPDDVAGTTASNANGLLPESCRITIRP